MTGADGFPRLNLPACSLHIRPGEHKDSRYVFDFVRNKYVRLVPEEWVRVHFLHFLVEECGYVPSLIAVEMHFEYQGMSRRADLVAYDRQGAPVLMTECKAPQVLPGAAAFEQVARYNRVVGARYLAVTNGLHHYCWRADRPGEFMDRIPSFEEVSAAGPAHDRPSTL